MSMSPFANIGGKNTMDEEIRNYCENVLKARMQRLESDLTTALILQDYDKISRLHVVYDYGDNVISPEPAVASFVGQDRPCVMNPEDDCSRSLPCARCPEDNGVFRG